MMDFKIIKFNLICKYFLFTFYLVVLKVCFESIFSTQYTVCLSGFIWFVVNVNLHVLVVSVSQLIGRHF